MVDSELGYLLGVFGPQPIFLLEAIATTLDCVGVCQLECLVDAESRAIFLILRIIKRTTTYGENLAHIVQYHTESTSPDNIMHVGRLWRKCKNRFLIAMCMHVQKHA